MSDTKKYQVLPGVFHGKNREYGPGSIVDLTDKEAAPLLGFKVAAYDGSAVPEQAAAPIDPGGKGSGEETADLGKLADDLSDEEEAARLEAAALVAKAAKSAKK